MFEKSNRQLFAYRSLLKRKFSSAFHFPKVISEPDEIFFEYSKLAVLVLAEGSLFRGLLGCFESVAYWIRLYQFDIEMKPKALFFTTNGIRTTKILPNTSRNNAQNHHAITSLIIRYAFFMFTSSKKMMLDK